MGATGLRVIWLSVWAVVGVIAPVCGRASDGEVSRPPRNRLNIVFILADDLGYGELGCFGQEKIRTPHLDALARDGMRLTQHYAGAPTCAASWWAAR